MNLTIIYTRTDNSHVVKHFKVKENEVQTILANLQKNDKFIQIKGSKTITVIPSERIDEIRIEEDEASVSQSEREEATELGS
jgi:hypothetical protein